MEEKIIDKIKKLLAIANDSAASEGERDNALRMAHNFLIKHNLEMKDLQEHEIKENRIFERLETFQMKWCKGVAQSIAELFFCKMFTEGKVNGTKGRYCFVGKESNATTAAVMTEYVISSILKEARKLYGSNLAPESTSFGHGAKVKLWQRVKEMIKTTSISEGTGLVVVEMYKQEQNANNEFISQGGIKLVPSKSKKTAISNLAAFGAGSVFGNKIDLNLQVQDNKPNSLQIGVK